MSEPATGEGRAAVSRDESTSVSREYPAHPLLGVGAFVFAEDGALLMVQRAKEPARGRWSIPGGLVEVGERLQTAVAREVLEETGIVVQPLAQVEVVERVIPDGAGRVRFHYVLVDFLCRVTGGRLAACSDAAAAEWVPAAEWQAEESGRIEGFTRAVLRKAWAMQKHTTNPTTPSTSN